MIRAYFGKRFVTSLLALTSFGSYNKRVSGFVPSSLRPNPSLPLRTSDTRKRYTPLQNQKYLNYNIYVMAILIGNIPYT